VLPFHFALRRIVLFHNVPYSFDYYNKSKHTYCFTVLLKVRMFFDRSNTRVAVSNLASVFTR